MGPASELPVVAFANSDYSCASCCRHAGLRVEQELSHASRRGINGLSRRVQNVVRRPKAAPSNGPAMAVSRALCEIRHLTRSSSLFWFQTGPELSTFIL